MCYLSGSYPCDLDLLDVVYVAGVGAARHVVAVKQHGHRVRAYIGQISCIVLEFIFHYLLMATGP